MAAENAYKYYEHAYSAAPKKAPEQQREKKPELKRVRKTKNEILVQNEKAANRKLLKVAAVVFMFLALYAVVCNSFAAKDQARRALDTVKEEYVFAQAKNRELQVQMNHLISAENIDKIAVEKLGLVKLTAGSEIYLDTVEGNRVIFAENS